MTWYPIVAAHAAGKDLTSHDYLYGRHLVVPLSTYHSLHYQNKNSSVIVIFSTFVNKWKRIITLRNQSAKQSAIQFQLFYKHAHTSTPNRRTSVSFSIAGVAAPSRLQHCIPRERDERVVQCPTRGRWPVLFCAQTPCQVSRLVQSIKYI